MTAPGENLNKINPSISGLERKASAHAISNVKFA